GLRPASGVGSGSGGARGRTRRPRSCWLVATAAAATAGPKGPSAGWCTAVIDLLVGDDRRGFGITAAFAMEGVPARRIDRAAEFDARVLVVAADRLDDAASALARRVPTVVICAGDALQPVSDGPFSLSLDDAIWPAAVRRVALAHGHDAFRLPQATGYLARDLPGTVLGSFQDAHGRRAPAVVQQGRQVWCLLDLGAALSDLLTESYLPEPATRALRPGITRSALALYYRA